MESKKCIKCGLLAMYDRSEKNSNYMVSYYLEGRVTMVGSICHLCKKSRQKEVRSQTGDASTKKYEKTKSGFLMRAYRNMKSRITGVQKKKAHLYAGLSLMSRDDFYAFSLESESFHTLFAAYETADYDQRICPSVDRIDSKLGYEPGNIQWITHSENSAKANRRV